MHLASGLFTFTLSDQNLVCISSLPRVLHGLDPCQITNYAGNGFYSFPYSLRASTKQYTVTVFRILTSFTIYRQFLSCFQVTGSHYIDLFFMLVVAVEIQHYITTSMKTKATVNDNRV